jgi:hypothetical protein
VNQGPSRVCGRHRNNRSGGSSVSGLIDGIMGVSPVLAYALVALLVFAEDALFIGSSFRAKRLRFSME